MSTTPHSGARAAPEQMIAHCLLRSAAAGKVLAAWDLRCLPPMVARRLQLQARDPGRKPRFLAVQAGCSRRAVCQRQHDSGDRRAEHSGGGYAASATRSGAWTGRASPSRVACLVPLERFALTIAYFAAT